jgi:hypothetical protein
MKTTEAKEKTSMKSTRAEKEDNHPQDTQYPHETYEIMVQGQLDNLWKQWFEGMSLSSVENGESGVACTLIVGQIADQSALHGLLIKIRDLNLKLLSVLRVKPGKSKNEEANINLDP